METIRKIAVLLVAIALVVGLGPFVLRTLWPAWGLKRDLASGAMRWEPVYGVIVERELGASTWEQCIVGWVGPGTIQVVQYADSGGSELLDDGGPSRTRLGTAEKRVTLSIARLYTVARAPDEFPVVIRQQYDGSAGFELVPDTGGDRVIAPFGVVFFAEHAAVRLTKPYRWGFKRLSAGDVLYLDYGCWSSVDQGGLNFVDGLPEGSYAGFTIMNGVRVRPGMATPDRIEALKGLMSRTAGGETGLPYDGAGTGLEFGREPEKPALASTLARLMYTADWAFPLPEELDLAAKLSPAELDAGIGEYSAGWGYSLPLELSPANNSVWFLRCLEQTEIAVPYTPPF